ncbi:SDR family oxidoreductase [Actinomadura sp. WAC 06369]|uniref:SDR family oxidoreductase n=1 Tax=Actinomadura sp. WAC 06369 TaxID=2203193 RepID=UPI000F78C413|nr:SDR family oxidoreductase [Actinomadura sp. WAC 06369]RSN69274.1 short-chain dehydrogenase [Actinomadura sp. WAC 06369]
MGTLDGTAALVTGGGSGIGLGCALRLAAAGAAVTICGRTEERLRDAAERAREDTGHDIGHVVADVTDDAQVAEAVRAAGERGPLRTVVASAGGSSSIGPIGDLDLEQWRATLELNATGTMLTIRHAARAMARDGGGGSIIAISSIASSNTHRWFGAYGVSKAAVDHLVRLAADELGGVGVRVNGVRPGIVRTELVAGIADTGPVLEDYLSCMPLARVGEPADIAGAVAFLAGPEASWITGQVLNVDGGHHLRRGPDYSSFFEPMFGADALRGVPPEDAR